MEPDKCDFQDTIINIEVEEITWEDYVAACDILNKKDFQSTVKLDLDIQDFDCPEK